jgi:hypothetical protein
VQKLTNRDIERIVKQWERKKPIPEIAKYFGVSHQWIPTSSSAINNQERFPFFIDPVENRKLSPQKPGFLSWRASTIRGINLGHLEKKIKDVHGIHIPHNTIYRIFVSK